MREVKEADVDQSIPELSDKIRPGRRRREQSIVEDGNICEVDRHDFLTTDYAQTSDVCLFNRLGDVPMSDSAMTRYESPRS